MEAISIEKLNRWAHELLGNCWHEYYICKKTFVSHWRCVECQDKIEKGFLNESYNWALEDSPNYCLDLNLAAMVEWVIPKEKWNTYKSELDMIVREQMVEDGCRHGLSFKWITATAEQRLRAAYLTLEGE